MNTREIVINELYVLPEYKYCMYLKMGLYRLGRIKFKDFSTTFKTFYQEIQGPKGW